MEVPAKESAFVVIAKRNPGSEDRARSNGSAVFDLGAVSGRELTNLSEKPLVRVAKKLEVALDASSEYHRRFMAGVYKRVTSVYDKALELLPSTSSELMEVLRLWSKNEGRDADEPFEALFSAWQVKGFKDSTQGKLIIRLNERKSSLVEVIRACNRLLGPPHRVFLDTLDLWTKMSTNEEEESEERSRRQPRPRPSRQQYRAAPRDLFREAFVRTMNDYIQSNVQEAATEPLEMLRDEWDMSGIFLRLDMEDAKKRYPVTRGTKKKPEELKMLEDFSKNRVAWIAAFKSVIEDFSKKFIGMESVKDQLGLYISRLLLPIMDFDGYLNFAVMGNPGTGKTELSKRIGQVFYYLGFLPRVADNARLVAPFRYSSDAHYIKLSTRDLVAEFVGQTAHATALALVSGLGRLVAVDEAYAIVDNDFGKECVTQIVNDVDYYRGILSVAFMGYEDGVNRRLIGANPGLKRRITESWIIDNYKPDELFRIITAEMTRAGMKDPTEAQLKTLNLRKYNVAFFQKLVLNALTALYDRRALVNLNAGVTSHILNAYQNVYAQVVDELPAVDSEIWAKESNTKLIWYDILVKAVVVFADKVLDLEMRVFDERPQDEVDNRPLSVSPEGPREFGNPVPELIPPTNDVGVTPQQQTPMRPKTATRKA